MLKERRPKNKKAEREDGKRGKVPVVWRDEMIWKRELEGVTENQQQEKTRMFMVERLEAKQPKERKKKKRAMSSVNIV